MTLSDREGTKLGDLQFAQEDGVAGARAARARRDRRRAGPVGRLRALRGRPSVLGDRRGRCARRRGSRRRRLHVRADVLDLDDDRGVPEPAGDLGARPRLVHDRAVLRARDVRLPGRHRPDRVRERRARGSAARAAVDRLQPRHLQVRARRGVHRRAEDAAQAEPRLDGAGDRSRDAGRAARRRRGGAARSRDARRPDARPHLRGHVRHRDGQGRAAEGDLPLPRGRRTRRRCARDGAQAVVWQTAINPVVALELLASGTWSGTGVLGPEAFDAVPFLDLLGDYGSPHGVDERTP